MISRNEPELIKKLLNKSQRQHNKKSIDKRFLITYNTFRLKISLFFKCIVLYLKHNKKELRSCKL